MTSLRDDARRVLRSFPTQLIEGLDVPIPSLPRAFDRVVLCGMGGSALAGLFLRDILRSQGSPALSVHQSYGLPLEAGADALVVMLSHSGNTEETLSAFEEIRRRSLTGITVSSGGLLRNRANNAGYPWISIPVLTDGSRLQPRHSLPAQMGILAVILDAATGSSLRRDLQSAAEHLNVEDLETTAISIIEAIGDRTPILASSDRLHAAAYNWKIHWNETAKRHAFSSALPESNHNELEANEPTAFAFLFLRDSDDHPRIQRRVQLTANMRTHQGNTALVIDLPGRDPVERQLNGALLGWWTAFLAAEERGTDPFAVETIEAFKRKL